MNLQCLSVCARELSVVATKRANDLFNPAVAIKQLAMPTPAMPTLTLTAARSSGYAPALALAEAFIQVAPTNLEAQDDEFGAHARTSGSRVPSTDGLPFHSVRGSVCTSDDYQKALRHNAITCSMSRRGDCWDNAVAEGFFGTLKTERVHRVIFVTRELARSAIAEWTEIFHKGNRRDSSLGYATQAARRGATRPDISDSSLHVLERCRSGGAAAEAAWSQSTLLRANRTTSISINLVSTEPGNADLGLLDEKGVAAVERPKRARGRKRRKQPRELLQLKLVSDHRGSRQEGNDAMATGPEKLDAFIVPLGRRKSVPAAMATRGAKKNTANEETNQLALFARSTTILDSSAMSMEVIADQRNLLRAFAAATANQGAPGPDKESIEFVQSKLARRIPALTQ